MIQQLRDAYARNEHGIWAVGLTILLVALLARMQTTSGESIDLTNWTTQWLLGVAFAALVVIVVGYKREWIVNRLTDFRGSNPRDKAIRTLSAILVAFGGWSLAFVGAAILSAQNGPVGDPSVDWVFVRASAASFLIGVAIRTSTILRVIHDKRGEEPDSGDTDGGADASDEDATGSSQMAYVGRDSYP